MPPTLGWSKPKANSQPSFKVSALDSRHTKSVGGGRVGDAKRYSVIDMPARKCFLVEVPMRRALTIRGPGSANAQIFRRSSVGSSGNFVNDFDGGVLILVIFCF